MIEATDRREPTGETDTPVPGPGGLFLPALGWGLVAGWLDLGLVLTRRTLDPTISMASLRTNRHFWWMIPASDVLLLGAAGLAVAALARLRPGWARGLAWRLYAGLAALAVLLDVEGLHGAAAAAAAVGVGVRLGPSARRLAVRFGRPARAVLAAAAVGAVALAVTTYLAVTTAERRALAALPPADPGAPNVLLLVLDNVRASSLSLYGHDRPTSPNLERLARDGVRFTHARSTSSWTLAAHASLFTGRWCHELSYGYNRPFETTHATLAEALARRGYATAGFVGNTYYCNARYGLGRGFARYEDHYENEAVTPFEVVRSTGLGRAVLRALGFPVRFDEGASVRKTAAMVNRDLLSWLDERPRDRPFFAFANYFDAHTPFLPPDGPDPRFGLAALPYAERARIVKRELRFLTDPVAAARPDADRVRREAAAVRLDSYESCIAYLDRQLGALFDALDRRGLRDNTLIVVTSDHGEHFAERGFYGHGVGLYRPEVDIPLLVFPPAPAAGAAGRTIDVPVSLRDTAATVVDLLGCADREPFPGQSFARFWRPGAPGPGTPLLSELGRRDDLEPSDHIPTSRGALKAVADGDFVYIRNTDGREELYDLHRDPLEVLNLVAKPSHRATAERCRGKLDDILRTAADVRVTEADAVKPDRKGTLDD